MPCKIGYIIKNSRARCRFLGLTGPYQNFVKDYGKIAAPLKNLLKNDVFTWTHFTECAFDKLKQDMCTKPVLVMPDVSKPFTIENDACDNGLGVVLLQYEHPIAFTRNPFSVRI